MENIRELCAKLLSNSKENNLMLGRIVLDSLLAVLPNDDKEQRNVSNWLITCFCFKVIASDGKISDEEVDYFNKLMNVSFTKDDIYKKIDFFKIEIDDLIKNISEYKDEIKNNFLTLAILFAASDGEISEKEIKLLDKINSNLGEINGI